MGLLVLILHVVGAVFVVGPMAILPQSGLRAIRSGNAGAVRTLARSTFIFTMISIVVAVLGFGLVGLSPAKYHLSVLTPWVLSSVLAWLIALLLSVLVVVPAMRAAAAALDTIDPAVEAVAGDAAPAKAPGYTRVAVGSGLVSLLLLVVVVLMVWKP